MLRSFYGLRHAHFNQVERLETMECNEQGLQIWKDQREQLKILAYLKHKMQQQQQQQ